jgi:hypothetical protein
LTTSTYVFMATTSGHRQEDAAHRLFATRARPGSSRSTSMTATCLDRRGDHRR